jgi:hypothetical protein
MLIQQKSIIQEIIRLLILNVMVVGVICFIFRMQNNNNILVSNWLGAVYLFSGFLGFVSSLIINKIFLNIKGAIINSITYILSLIIIPAIISLSFPKDLPNIILGNVLLFFIPNIVGFAIGYIARDFLKTSPGT